MRCTSIAPSGPRSGTRNKRCAFCPASCWGFNGAGGSRSPDACLLDLYAVGGASTRLVIQDWRSLPASRVGLPPLTGAPRRRGGVFAHARARGTSSSCGFCSTCRRPGARLQWFRWRVRARGIVVVVLLVAFKNMDVPRDIRLSGPRWNWRERRSAARRLAPRSAVEGGVSTRSVVAGLAVANRVPDRPPVPCWRPSTRGGVFAIARTQGTPSL